MITCKNMKLVLVFVGAPVESESKYIWLVNMFALLFKQTCQEPHQTRARGTSKHEDEVLCMGGQPPPQKRGNC